MPFIRRKRKLPLRVEDLMSTPPIIIDRDQPVEKAAKLMYENNVGSIIVVDKNGKIEGILTERDLVFAVANGKVGKNYPVWMLMTENPITVNPGTPIIDALKTMRRANIRHLPVVDREGKPLGMLSMRDIVEAIITLLGVTME